MYYSIKRGYLNIILTVIIFIASILLVSWISYNTGRSVGEGLESSCFGRGGIIEGVEIPLTTISMAQNANLQKSNAVAKMSSVEGKVEIALFLSEGNLIPEGSVLSAWMIDTGSQGGIGKTSSSENDQKYGTPFSNVDYSKKVEEAPFSLYLGKFEYDEKRNGYYVYYSSSDVFDPYDTIMITIESDGNIGDYDPRPGTPILIGEIKK